MNIRLAMVAAMLVPAALSAQQPGANPIAQSFRGFGYFGSWLVVAFDSIPASRYDFRPAPAQLTVGQIARHLEDANYQLCGRFGGITPARPAADSLAWPKDTLTARSWRQCGSARTPWTR